MISRLVAWTSQIRVTRFVQSVLALGVTVLLMTRAARPSGLWSGVAVGAAILVPNLLSRKFRLSVWMSSLFVAYALLLFTRLVPVTNPLLHAGCEVQPEGGVRRSDLLELPETIALLWFGAAMAAGVLFRFVDRGVSGRLDAGARRLVVAGGLWLAAAGGVSLSDEILRVPHVARCNCDQYTISFAELVCPSMTSACATVDRDLHSVACAPLVSPVARAGAKAAWGLVGMGLAIAAIGCASRRRAGADAREDAQSIALERRGVIDGRLMLGALVAIPFFFLGVYKTILMEVPDLLYLVSSRVMEWLVKHWG